jgi:hypothetical protein
VRFFDGHYCTFGLRRGLLASNFEEIRGWLCERTTSEQLNSFPVLENSLNTTRSEFGAGQVSLDT